MKSRISSFIIMAIVFMCILNSCQGIEVKNSDSTSNIPLSSLMMSQGLIGFSENGDIEYNYLWFDNLDAIKHNNAPIQYFWESLLEQKDSVCKTDDTITCAEYLKFDMVMADGSQYELWLLYDYDSEMEYILYENDLYHICFFWPWEWGTWISGALWYGPSSEYMMSLTEYNVFRYQQHWRSGDRSAKLRLNITSDSQINLTSNEKVVNATCQLFPNQSVQEAQWYYDETTQLWLVRLKFDQIIDISSIINCASYRESQNNQKTRIYAIWHIDGTLIECGIWL